MRFINDWNEKLYRALLRKSRFHSAGAEENPLRASNFRWRQGLGGSSDRTKSMRGQQKPDYQLTLQIFEPNLKPGALREGPVRPGIESSAFCASSNSQMAAEAPRPRRRSSAHGGTHFCGLVPLRQQDLSIYRVRPSEQQRSRGLIRDRERDAGASRSGCFGRTPKGSR